MDTNFIKDLLNSLKFEAIRFRTWCVLLFILVAFAVLGVGYLLPNTYITEATLYVDQTNIIEPLLKGRASVTDVDRSAQAREIIYTRQILEQVAKEAGMVDAASSQEDIGRAMGLLGAGLSIEPESKNYFRMSYKSNDPDRAFQELNAIINVFIEYTARKKREESLSAFNFIDAQVETYKRQLEAAEGKLQEFQAQNTEGTEATVTARINQLRIEIENLKIATEGSKSRIGSIKQQLTEESQYQLSKGKIEELRERRAVLSTQLDTLLRRYQESYPDVISLRDQVAAVDQEIEALELGGQSFGSGEKVENPLYEELRKQLSAAEVELQAQERRMQSLIHLQEQEFKRAERIAANQAELSELTRDYTVTRDVYEEMLQRKESARLSMTLDIEGQGVSYKIQEPASFPLKPSGLRFIHFALVGPFLGILAPLGLLFAYVFLDPHFRSARALQQQMPEGIELMGVIPHYHTPLGERLMRKDMLVLLGLCLVMMAAYVGVAINWYDVKN